MVAGPEVARLISEYEDKFSIHQESSPLHHEQIPSVQKKFLSNVKSIIEIIDDIGNPFSESSTDLYSLDTKAVMPASVIETV